MRWFGNVALFSTMLVVFGLSSHSVATAQTVNYGVPTVVEHDLDCGDVFVCPPELRRRIDFWIQVFRLWQIEDRIFHDSAVPERVYSVINSKDQCRRRNPRGEVKKEFEKIKGQLKKLAGQLERGQQPTGRQAQRLLSLFEDPSPAELRDAADRIRCQSGNRERFQGALERFAQYQPFILQTLQQQGLSLDIQYLPFVESAYNPKAYSHAGAAGLWQIMPRTARSLGLQVGAAVDERLEPQLASLAAAKYLRDSTDSLTKIAVKNGHPTVPASLNPFVITSYNYGVRGMQRAIAQVGTDYVRLLEEYKSPSFRIAVRNFYASFLAARHVAQNSSLYFPQVTHKPALQADSIALAKSVMAREVLKSFAVDRATLQELNPALTRSVWRGKRAIPAGYVLKVPAKVGGWKKQVARLTAAPAPAGADSGKRHRVRRGQTACGIASSYGVRCRDLIVLNNLNRKALIRVGQRLKIPSTGREKYKPGSLARKNSDFLAAANSQSAPEVEDVVETKLSFDTAIRQNNRGYWVSALPSETLGHYADWLGTGRSADIRRLNNLGSKASLWVGRHIQLPIKSQTQKDAFEAQRADYHEAIASQYFQRFEVVKTYDYRVRKGQTLWQIARNAGVPLWLIYNYNPGELLAQAGRRIVLPEVRQRIAN